MATEEKVIYFSFKDRLDTVTIPSDATPEEVRDIFLKRASLDYGDIIVLSNWAGDPLRLDASLASNDKSKPYRLILVTPAKKDVFKEGIEEQLTELENRLILVEERVRSLHIELPPAVDELKEAVIKFRRRLDASEAFAWLGQYREGINMPARIWDAEPDAHPYWRHVRYRRKVEEEVSEVVSRFRDICESTVTEETQEILRLPAFNTWVWQDWELLLHLQHMYEDLNLRTFLKIDREVLHSFLCSVYLNYNQVPFHNFRHAFSVTQMMYGIICKCNLREHYDDFDLVILLTSCVCHDLDHPGFNNIYQINAKTELALLYNDISPLENHHCAVAFTILEKVENNLFRNLLAEDYKRVREGIIRCILATDMARHNEILQDFRDVIPNFDFKEKSHSNLLFMILIKVADISNEARPLDIAEPWLECLMQEFFNQSDLEKLEGLPVSPFMDREKVTKPSSQVSFIGFVLLPLFEALGEVLPQLEKLLIEPVKDALEHYRHLNDVAKSLSEQREDNTDNIANGNQVYVEMEDTLMSDHPEETALDNESIPSSTSQETLRKILSKTESFTSLKSRTSSRASGLLRAASSRETDTELDPTETEVEVSERTSRFKISTDSHKNSRRNSYERKGSVDGRVYERTVSPRQLEERLLPHAEVECEDQPSSPATPSHLLGTKEKENFVPQKSTSTSILSRIWSFADRSSPLDKDRGSPILDRSSDKLSKKSKEDKEGRPILTRTKRSLSSNIEKTAKENPKKDAKKGEKSPLTINDKNVSSFEIKPSSSFDFLDIKGEHDVRAVRFSPTLSEKCSSPSNSILCHKKMSLSLDVLTKKEAQAAKEPPSTPHNTPRCSDHKFFPNPSLEKQKSIFSRSPKTLKKKHESAKAILWRSFSFKRRSPTKDKKDKSNNSRLNHSEGVL